MNRLRSLLFISLCLASGCGESSIQLSSYKFCWTTAKFCNPEYEIVGNESESNLYRLDGFLNLRVPVNSNGLSPSVFDELESLGFSRDLRGLFLALTETLSSPEEVPTRDLSRALRLLEFRRVFLGVSTSSSVQFHLSPGRNLISIRKCNAADLLSLFEETEKGVSEYFFETPKDTRIRSVPSTER